MTRGSTAAGISPPVPVPIPVPVGAIPRRTQITPFASRDDDLARRALPHAGNVMGQAIAQCRRRLQVLFFLGGEGVAVFFH